MPVDAYVLMVPITSFDAAIPNGLAIGDFIVLLGDIREKREALPIF